MRRVVRITVWGLAASLAAAALWLRGCGVGRGLASLRLPPGFTIAAYADSVPDARSLALGARGTVFVGSRDAGVVYALVDTNRDARADEVIPLLHGLGAPNGVAFRDGALYVADVSRILRYDSIESRLRRPPTPVVVTDGLPREGHHGWRYIGFGPDGWLYVGSGAPCNICNPPAELFATILRLKPNGDSLQVFARGVRNTVGFDWNPDTHELWFTDNGRDWLGADEPPDELNRAPRPGLHFGYPVCHAGTLLDPEFGAGQRCADYAPPQQRLGAHVAALGMRFYTGTMFPPEYRGQIFIAEHGSWNRVIPVGYRITLVRLGGAGRPVSYEPFAKGWLRGGSAWGRPVDVLVMPDGALLVSDDRAGVVYRIAYTSR
ncbi:MAG TPA: PQQ-dependent sugar dehydrogenase [Gemmatimonadales bacterium]|nr:PQQ-dependent sugar dehydrogenase [Gemmatimonadales bacterium]